MEQAHDADAAAAEPPPRATAWLSRGLEALVADMPQIEFTQRAEGERDFDVVIVGSGYGAAVAASELAGLRDASQRALTVCVLERGSEYLRGMFPSRLSDLAGHARFATPEAAQASGRRDGLFDLRLGGDATVVVANGVGGGSLINAGVMLMPHRAVFRDGRWPPALRRPRGLYRLAGELRERLGARRVGSPPTKLGRLQTLAGTQPMAAIPITVAPTEGANAANTLLDACIACGDCATGCNHNAKDSLDLNLLRVAHAAGARIVSGATVLRVEKLDGGGWAVVLNHTDGHLRDRQRRPYRLRAARVILAAGTLGSSEILMRSQAEGLRFSDQLGQRFSGNGDMIAVAFGLKRPVVAVAAEHTEPGGRGVGPTISGMIDLRRGDPASDLVIQDLAVPGPLRRLFEESMTTAELLRRLAQADTRCHRPGLKYDDAAVDPQAIRRALPLALIGHDAADGVLHHGSRALDDTRDGVLAVAWPTLRADPRFDAHHATLRALLDASGLGGAVLANPMWRPLSSELEAVFGNQRGPLLTVHPLGGCVMGETGRDGVVDALGRVFDADSHSGRRHEGLVVLDGAIVPTSLGINPALTISALALRAVRALVVEWGLVRPQAAPPPPPLQRRPLFHIPAVEAPRATEIEITEQMRGEVLLDPGGGAPAQRRWLELTLTFEPKSLAELMARRGPPSHRTLTVSPGSSRLRVLNTLPDPQTDTPQPHEIELEAGVAGSLRVFHLETSAWPQRLLRGLGAWWLNRGFRDVSQRAVESVRERLRMASPEDRPTRGLGGWLVDILKLSTRSGAVRLMAYELTIVAPAHPQFHGRAVRGVKRITYSCGANVWLQLQQMTLLQFPTLVERGPAPQLTLNLCHLTRQGVPLLRVLRQQDRPAALVDLLSFGLYVARLLLQVHLLSLRKPDPPTARMPVRLPGHVPGLPPPQIESLVVGQRDGAPIHIRLARYRRPAAMCADAPPVLLIHGYSASGTTFAHPAVKGNLAQVLCDAGRDVWVLDMRSSAGMPTATAPWAFEDMAHVDIPAAVDHLCRAAGSVRVDVVAHCMGSAMFAMALLAPDAPGAPNPLRGRIGRVAMSQIGPLMLMTPANLFRAYVMRWVKAFLPLGDYAFRVEGKVSIADQLIDRVLATTQYPRDEFDLENPRWPPGLATPWAGTRHRMDALYARTFKLANMPAAVLAQIDDFFGPLSVETVSQVIHFARMKTVTDRAGVNRYVDPFRLRERLCFPMLGLHGAENGLADPATLDLLRDRFVGAGIRHVALPDAPGGHARTPGEALALIERAQPLLRAGGASFIGWKVAGHGHQDCLIGKDAARVNGVIAAFLRR